MGQMGDQDSDNVSNLQNSIDIQNKEKKHKCNYSNCDAVFLQPSRLKRHIRLHTGEVTIMSMKMILLCDFITSMLTTYDFVR